MDNSISDNSGIYIKVRKLIAEVLNSDEASIGLNSKIIDELGAESLDIVTLLMEFEDAFNMKIPDDDIQKMLTVSDIVEYIKNKTGIKDSGSSN